jgi:hypothetical protein
LFNEVSPLKHLKSIVLFGFSGILLFSIMLPLSGCSSSKSSTSKQTATTTTSPISGTSLPAGYVLVKSVDGNISIAVPSEWNTDDKQLYPGSVIGVADTAANEFLIITEKPKTSLAAKSTINDYLNVVKEAFGLVITSPVWGQPSNVTIGGCKGLAVRLTGIRKSNKTDTVYFINALESKNYFYNVCGYTLTSSENANKAAIEKIINSFKEKD